ncbi:uncharacterized protein [Asterias amurensis]|uniref:uncharacterized protein n=1 Tax=Asterias amurensis TaxID=7602 RepID=UPI003AB80C99
MTGRGNSLDTWACETVIPLPDDIRAEFPLDPFYQKYTHAYGIPIISSDNTRDAAVIRACYTVRFLLADRKDIRDSMFDQYGRVGVIAQSERTTEIPEHSYLDSDFIDNRARGLGGIPSIPITTNAEENLLCLFFEDRWFLEDVLVHEFAHSIHLISLDKIDPSFSETLASVYTMAKEDNLFPNTYAISKRTEYFAEGVQSFFNVQTCTSFQDGVHNNICTRDALMDYDPRLYNLIAQVFPCKNVLVDRCETNQTLAANQVVNMSCDVSVTTEDPTTQTTSASTTIEVAATNLPSNDAIKIAAGVIVPIVVISAVIGLVFAYKHLTTKNKVTAAQLSVHE